MKTTTMIIGVLCVLLFLSVWEVKHLREREANYSEHLSLYIDSLNTYRINYPSSDFELLKRENKLLYDELKDAKGNITEVVRWKTRIQYVDSGKVREIMPDDSLFRFKKESDTISYKLDITASSVANYNLDFKLNNQFTIVKREDRKGNNQLDINSGMNGNITDVTAWSKRKKEFPISFGIGVGAGYGLINNKPDIFVGATITYKIWK